MNPTTIKILENMNTVLELLNIPVDPFIAELLQDNKKLIEQLKTEDK